MSEMQVSQKGVRLAGVLGRQMEKILGEWMREMNTSTRRGDLIKEPDLRAECSQFLQLMRQATESAGSNFQSPAFDAVRDMLGEISRTRSHKGFKPSETATFV